jgi:hypothetical protein
MVRTFRDLQNDEDRDDDHADQDPQQDFFAGGEKSGLAVQDPNRRPQDHFRNILNQAREYVAANVRSVNPANTRPGTANVLLTRTKMKHPHSPAPSPAAPKPLEATTPLRVSLMIPMPSLHLQTPDLRYLASVAHSISGRMASASTTASCTALMTLRMPLSSLSSTKVVPRLPCSASNQARKSISSSTLTRMKSTCNQRNSTSLSVVPVSA